MNIETGLKGEYNLVVTKPNGSTNETGWFNNIILNQGLDRIGLSASVINYCQIGTGNTTPVITQTGLSSYTAGAGTSGSPTITNAGSPTYASIHTSSYPFAQGSVVGNMAEIGVGWAVNGNNLFSRALITDSGGQPTTISVTSIDQLTVYYRLTLTPSTTTGSGSVVLAGTTHNYVSSLAYAASCYNQATLMGSDFYSSYNSSYCFYTAPASVTTLGPITGIFSSANGWFYNNGGPSGSTAAYTLGSYYRDTTYAFAVSSANEAGGIGAVAPVLGSSGGNPIAQYVFTPPIPKTNTKTFSLTFRVSWARG